MKNVIAVIALLLFANSAVALPCRGATGQNPTIGLNTPWTVDYSIYDYVINQGHSEIGNAIAAAVRAWDNTNALNRLGSWNGMYAASGCPSINNNPRIQFSYLSFSTSTCPNVVYLRNKGWLSGNTGYSDSMPYSDCPACGSGSILLNSDNFFNAVTTSGEAGKTDFQSLLTHELGHTLGSGHYNSVADGGQCEALPSYNNDLYYNTNVATFLRSASNAYPTMASVVAGYTTQRVPSYTDQLNMQYIYP